MRVSAGAEAAKDREFATDSGRIVGGFDHGTAWWSIESRVTPRRCWHARSFWKKSGGSRIMAMLRSRIAFVTITRFLSLRPDTSCRSIGAVCIVSDHRHLPGKYFRDERLVYWSLKTTTQLTSISSVRCVAVRFQNRNQFAS